MEKKKNPNPKQDNNKQKKPHHSHPFSSYPPFNILPYILVELSLIADPLHQDLAQYRHKNSPKS